MKKTYTLAVLAATSMAANAALIVDTIDASFGEVSGNTAGADIGHTFTTGLLGTETQLSTIAIATPDSDTNGATQYRLQLFADADATSTTWGLGTVLGLSDLQTFRASDGAVTTFTFSGVTLADNTVYGYRWMDAAGTTPIASLRLTGVANNTAGSITAAGGEIFANSVQTFNRAAPIEVTTVTAVPEPSSAALIGLGGLTLILRRRK